MQNADKLSAPLRELHLDAANVFKDSYLVGCRKKEDRGTSLNYLIGYVALPFTA
jgi:hypothetical protein